MQKLTWECVRLFYNQNHEFGYWFPPYKKYIPHRLRVLRLALKDLERIKEEYGKD